MEKQISKLGYNFPNIVDMIKAIENIVIFDKLRMVQQDEFNRIKKKYSRLRYLTEQYLNYLKSLYKDFVLNGFTFEDKKPKVKEVNTIEHIGLQMLN